MSALKRILVQVAGNTSVFEVDPNGQFINGATLNTPGQSLHAVIQKYWGHPNILLVKDVLFGTGYHSVTTGHSAGGHAFCFNLHPFFSAEEEEAANKKVYESAKFHGVKEKSGVVLAFDKLEEESQYPSPSFDYPSPDAEDHNYDPREAWEPSGG